MGGGGGGFIACESNEYIGGLGKRKGVRAVRCLTFHDPPCALLSFFVSLEPSTTSAEERAANAQYQKRTGNFRLMNIPLKYRQKKPVIKVYAITAQL